jgi:hypothetical protein
MANLSVRIKTWAARHRWNSSLIGLLVVAAITAAFGRLFGVSKDDFVKAVWPLATSVIAVPLLPLTGVGLLACVGVYAIWERCFRPPQMPDQYSDIRWKCKWSRQQIKSKLDPRCLLPGCDQQLSNSAVEKTGKTWTVFSCECGFRREIRGDIATILINVRKTLERQAILQHEGKNWVDHPGSYAP